MLRWDMRDSDSDGVVTAAPAVVEDAEGELMRLEPRRDGARGEGRRALGHRSPGDPAPHGREFRRPASSLPQEPRDWRVVTRYPGVSCVPMTLREALLCAKRFRGDVVPREYQPKGGVYPHPGKMREGGKA